MHLRYFNTTTIRNEDCRGYLEAAELDFHVLDDTICTDNAIDEGLTNVNNGAALVSLADGKLIGIASVAVFKESKSYPDIYTRVDLFNEWITSVISKNIEIWEDE